jgi:hypothetical protein
VGQEPRFKPVFVYEMKYRYSRFKSGILYCALQKKYLPAGAENFRARSGPQGAGAHFAKF